MIKFGISENYVPNWGVVQAIREVYQNFIDYGEFNVDIVDLEDGKVFVSIENDFTPETWEFLKIGFSKKSSGAIGGHGEGMKLSGLVFLRNDLRFRIYTPFGTAKACFYDDDSIGKCYGLDIVDAKVDKFKVSFECKSNDIDIFKNSVIKDEDIKHHSSYGDIVNKEEGNIYVGGLYVCHLKDLKYAINFKPMYISLGRDRDIPSTWDLEYYTNRVINSCESELKFKASDVTNREFNCGEIPNSLAKKFTPIIGKGGNMRMQSGKTIVTDRGLVNKIADNPTVKKKIEKLKYQALFKTRKSPTTVLKEYRESLGLSLDQDSKFATLIKLSTNWKNR